ncbi:MAG: hypothetical protein ACRDVE_14480 [Actinocrinis sp.]
MADNDAGQGVQTPMRLYVGEDWPKTADVWDRGDNAWLRIDGLGRPVATLRRVGWLDQKGRVWTEIPPQAGFDGGSLTPLLIDSREDGY